MSDTPRTDAIQHGPQAGSFFAMLDHARELERENAKLREALAPFAREFALWTAPTKTAVGICEMGFDPTEAEFTYEDLARAAAALNLTHQTNPHP